MMSKVLRKRALLVLFLSLFSCSPSCPTWNLQKANTCSPCYSSARIYSRENCGLELELDSDISGLRMYANLLSLALTPGDSNQVEFSIEICDEKYSFTGCLLQGGQRLLFPDEARDIILEALLTGDLVTISVGRYSSEIPSDNFPSLYHTI